MTELKLRRIEDGPFPINEDIAGLVPMASEAEQAALTADIANTKQRDPIVLWRGEVVDGRCRQKALLTINEKDIMYKELDDELTEEEVRIFVKSVNTRRNLTHTQKVMSACRDSLTNGKKLVDTAKAWGISRAILDNARYIAKQRPEMVQKLFDGKSVTIVNADGKEVDSNKISTIYAAIKREEQRVAEDNQYGWKEDSYIKTQKGKEWYYTQLKTLNDVRTKMLIAELANYKFKEEKKNIN